MATGDVPAAAQFKVALHCPGAPSCSVSCCLKIHLSLGRNHSLRSKCTRPSSEGTTSLLATPGGRPLSGSTGLGRRLQVEVPLHRPRPQSPLSPSSFTWDLARFWQSRGACGLWGPGTWTLLAAASSLPPTRVLPQRRLPLPRGRGPGPAGAAPAARRARFTGQESARDPARRPRRRGRRATAAAHLG